MLVCLFACPILVESSFQSTQKGQSSGSSSLSSSRLNFNLFIRRHRHRRLQVSSACSLEPWLPWGCKYYLFEDVSLNNSSDDSKRCFYFFSSSHSKTFSTPHSTTWIQNNFINSGQFIVSAFLVVSVDYDDCHK